jgi:SAM-dependent methyltransferase
MEMINMYVAERTLTFVNALFKSYGPSKIKKLLWDKEYSGDKWNFADNTVGDCVYPYLQRYIANGSVLDLGCGSGNTATELAATAYRVYVGVDISEGALAKARRRTEACGRADKNRFVCSDFLGYVPAEQFNVILFRESMYHVPLGKVRAILDYYSKYLTAGGVFIVRLKTSDGKNGNRKSRPTAMLEVIQREFDVVENCQCDESGATVIVFRQRCPSHKK